MRANGEDLPPVYAVKNEHGRSPYVLVCEHASNFLPAAYAKLGLSDSELERHIAWDIGASRVAELLSRRLDAPVVLSRYSRLLIDLNRPPESATSIPEISEMTVVPGNAGLSAAERAHRIATYFTPFQDRLAALLDARLQAGKPTVLLAIHSFTPTFIGVARPWHAGILFRRSVAFGTALAHALGGEAANIAENAPYNIEDDGDYTIPVHGEARGLDAVLIEIRQDLIGAEAGAAQWAARLAEALP